MSNRYEYKGHITLRSEDPKSKAHVCIYTDGDCPELEPATLRNAPKEFNHSAEGSQPLFYYSHWFICNPAFNRWEVSMQQGFKCLELHMYRIAGIELAVQMSQGMRLLYEVAADCKFRRMMCLLRNPVDDALSPIPSDVTDLPEREPDEVFFNKQPVEGISVTTPEELAALEKHLKLGGAVTDKQRKKRMRPVLR